MAPSIPSLSDKERIVLELLTGARQMYGLELVSESGGALKRGTVYVTLGRMEEKGYIVSRQQDSPPGAGGLPRRVYSPTPLGREILRAWTQVSRRLAPSFAR
jgi:PadR family transcriptional regulator, regulatory protein PadR